ARALASGRMRSYASAPPPARPKPGPLMQVPAPRGIAARDEPVPAAARAPYNAPAAPPPPPMAAMDRAASFSEKAKCVAPPDFERAESRAEREDPVVAILGKQLASGMWDDGKGGEVRATVRALLALLERGVTTAHPLHGAQVKKAVEALLERAVLV